MTAILREDRDGVRVLTLNRPELRNAIDLDLRVELADALDAAMRSETVRAIVLTGAGTMFCSGGDISTMRRMGPEEAGPRAELAQRVVRTIWQGPKPVIAAVEGGAFGAGLSLATACDRVVVADDARLSVSFQRVGLAGDMGIFSSLARRIGPARARQLLLLPREVTAKEGLDIGLVDEVVPAGTALASAVSDARRLAEGAPLAIAAVKRLLRHTGADPVAVLDLEAAEQVALFDSDDFAEGVAAFHERRTPVFRGT